MQTIEATAPGKLVLSGEYAVLVDAPALILAIDSRAKCRIEVKDSGDWEFVTRPPKWNGRCQLQDILAKDSSKQEVSRLISEIAGDSRLPQHAKVDLDTSAFFLKDKKLGTGSSAALTVALASALDSVLSTKTSLDSVRTAHAAVFGGGSGLDVATSYLGGLVRFQSGRGSKVTMDSALHIRFVFTGTSASTAPRVQRFKRWACSASIQRIAELRDAAAGAADSASDAYRFLESLDLFTKQLLRLDQDAEIGIWNAPHKACKKLADSLKISYKPCGAGGGDTGMVASVDPERLDQYLAQVADIGMTPLQLKQENDGVRLEKH